MKTPSAIRRKQFLILIGGLVGLVGVIMLGMYMSDPNRGKITSVERASLKAAELIKKYDAKPSSSVSAEENWIALSEKQIEGLRGENKELREQLEQMRKSIAAKDGSLELTNGLPMPTGEPVLPPPPPLASGEVRPILPKKAPPLSSPPGVENASFSPNDAPRSFNASVNTGPAPAKEGAGAIQMLSLRDDDKGAEKKKESKNVSHYLPTGFFGTAVLLSGIDAPTGGQAQTNPVPVLLRLMDPGRLPNFFKSDVKHCHVIGACYGDISSERAMIRLESLACVLEEGDIIETPVKGYVTGEDGKNGFRGKLVSKQGALIARALLAGVASGMSDAVAQQYRIVSTSALGQVSTLDPNKVAQAGLAGGASNALEKIADYYIARANETYPIIEVAASRIGEIILTGGSDVGRDFIGKTRQAPP